MGVRVVHWGTGYVGSIVLRTLLGGQDPDAQLVGHLVTSPAKVGKDSGEIVGAPPVGVLATDDRNAILDLGADCLIYCADSVNRELEAVEDLIPFLERGTNVVTISSWAVGHPAAMPPDLLSRLEAACRTGNSSCYFTGSDPGYATSEMAIAALGIAGRVDSIRMIEFACFKQYSAEYASREYFGFGKPPGFQPIMVTGGIIEQMWSPTLYRIAEVLGVVIDEFQTVYETESVDYDIDAAFGRVDAGTAAVVHFELHALNRGRPFAVVDHTDRLPTDARDESTKRWRQPYGPETSYRIEIEGEPRFNVELGGHSSLFNATPIVNCLPALVAARPGLIGPLEIPRYWSRNVTARVGDWP